MKKTLNLGIISDFNMEMIARFLNKNIELQNIFNLNIKLYDYLNIANILDSEFLQIRGHDILLIDINIKSFSPSFKQRYLDASNKDDGWKDDLQKYLKKIEAISLVNGSILISNWVESDFGLRGMLQSYSIDFGESNAIIKANYELLKYVERLQNVYLYDSADIKLEEGDIRSWYITKSRYSLKNSKIYADKISTNILNLKRGTKKIIVTDLDNTLWGGIIGDDGVDHLFIGGHSPIGEAHLDIQKFLLSLKNKGILLAIASKNTKVIALNAIQSHPEMIKESDFVDMEINWDEKSDSLRRIANRLNLGLDSFVFLDDSPLEREKISQVLPEVMVLKHNGSVYSMLLALRKLSEVFSLYHTQEDINKTELYKMEVSRRGALDSLTGVDVSMLAVGLELTIHVDEYNDLNKLRVVQLLNKTNQFNLSTRRLNETEFHLWCQFKGNHAYCFVVKDKFGEYGLTGILSYSVNLEASKIIVEDLILSCRVMGRGVEEVILSFLGDRASELDIVSGFFNYQKTSKNEPIRKFLSSSSLVRIEDDSFYLNMSGDNTLRMKSWINKFLRD